MALGFHAVVENDLLGSVKLEKESADTMVGPTKVTTFFVSMGWWLKDKEEGELELKGKYFTVYKHHIQLNRLTFHLNHKCPNKHKNIQKYQN